VSRNTRIGSSWKTFPGSLTSSHKVGGPF
jgi:hypothetical protein